MAEVTLATSATSDSAQIEGKACTVGRFISESDGWKIVDAAATWEGTPYGLVGAASQKGVIGDCSGTTNKSYVEAGFPYPYQSTGAFAAFAVKSNRFRKIDPSKQPLQAGDVLLWPGHMAIYAPFKPDSPKYDGGLFKHGVKKFNNMYTAFNNRTGKPYGAYNIETFRGDPYTVYRYFILPGEENCKP
ncbi:peptidoglycan endopeptidase [Burkholderia sp. Bp9125]|nr:peptidoglycan endopeptidase [Burkholderia sp. Bp9125]